MPNFRCPECNFKTFTEKDEKEHAKTHLKTAQPTEPEFKKLEEKNKNKSAEQKQVSRTSS